MVFDAFCSMHKIPLPVLSAWPSISALELLITFQSHQTEYLRI